MSSKQPLKPKMTYRIERSAYWPLVLCVGFLLGLTGGLMLAALVVTVTR